MQLVQSRKNLLLQKQKQCPNKTGEYEQSRHEKSTKNQEFRW